jgi:hypothetical protein
VAAFGGYFRLADGSWRSGLWAREVARRSGNRFLGEGLIPWVYLRSGKHLEFSGILGNFDDLVALVDDRLAEQPAGQHDSEEKLHDQANRIRDNRNAERFAYVGLVILAVAVFVMWWMGLLH